MLEAKKLALAAGYAPGGTDASDLLDKNANQLAALRLQMLKVQRIAGPEITFSKQGTVGLDRTAPANQQTLDNLGQEAALTSGIRDLATKYMGPGGPGVLGPEFQAEKAQLIKQSPLYQLNSGVKTGAPNALPKGVNSIRVIPASP